MARVKEDKSRVRLELDGKQAINELGKLELEAKELRVNIYNIKKEQDQWIKESGKLGALEERYNNLVTKQKSLEQAGKQSTKTYANNRNAIDKVSKELETARQASEKLKASQDQYSKESAKLTGVKTKIGDLRKELGLSGMTLGQLVRQQRDLRSQLTNTVTKGTTEYKRLHAELIKVNGAVVQQRDEMNKNGGFFTGLTGQVTKLAGAMGIVFGGAQIFQGLKKMVGLSGEFEQSLSNLSAITGAVGEELKFLEDEAKEVGSTTTFTASEAAKAFELIASKKPELLENRDALVATSKAAITLAEAAGIELPEAADALTNTLNQFNAGAEESERFINALAAGSKFGAGNIEFLNDAIGRFGPTAKAMNIEFEESVSIMEVFAEKGLVAEKSGVSFRNILVELAKGADETNPQIVGLQKAVENLGKQQLSTAELAQKFGTQNLTAAQILVNAGPRLAEFTRKVTDTNVAYEQAAIRVENFNGMMKEFQSIAEFYGIAFGRLVQNAITPFIRTMIDAGIAIKDFFNAAEASKRAFEDQSRSIDSLNKAIDPLLSRYEELQSKSSLSADEQEELKTVIQDISRLVPTAATEFDEYGTAIGISTGKVNEFRQAQIEANKVLNRKAIQEQEKDLEKLEKQIEITNRRLNQRNTEGDIIKLVNQQIGFQSVLKEVKLTGDEITDLQTKLASLQEQSSRGRLAIAGLSGEETPEMLAAKEKEKQDAITKAEEEALIAAEEAREEARKKAAEAAAAAREKQIAEERSKMERLQADFVKYQEDIQKIARDYEISQMEPMQAEEQRINDRYLKREEQLKNFHESQVITEEEFIARLVELETQKGLEIDAVKKGFQDKEDQERKAAHEKILQAIAETEDLSIEERHERDIEKTNAHWDEMSALAEKFGISELDLNNARLSSLNQLEDAYSQERVKIFMEEFEAKKQMFMTFGNAALNVLGMVNSFSKDSGEFEKVMAIGNAAIKSGEAIANMIAAFSTKGITPIDLAVRIAGGIGVITANIATAVRSINRAELPDPPPQPDTKEAAPQQRRGTTASRRSYFKGGATSDEGMGFGDKFGEFVGYVHKKEYVIPEMVTSHPWVANVLPAIEAIRQDKMRGFATGGPTTPDAMPFNESMMSNPEILQQLIRIANAVEKFPKELEVTGKWDYLGFKKIDEEWTTLEKKYRA